MARRDPHSCADDAQPRPRHLRLRLEADFDARALRGEATLDLAAPAGGTLDLDSRSLAVASVVSDTGASVPFELGDEDPILGRRLRLTLPAGTRSVTLRYATAPDAPALQWLSPEQTAAGSTRSCSASARPSTRAAWCRCRTRRGCGSRTRRRSWCRRRSPP